MDKDNEFPRAKYLIRGFFAGFVAAILWAAGIWGARQYLRQPSGVQLNQMAWEASFKERGLTPPSTGPREGYWGARLWTPYPYESPQVGKLLSGRKLRGLFDFDDEGFQHARSLANDGVHITIIGGSVATGAYASRETKTYFSRLAEKLYERSLPAQVDVIGGGGWNVIDEYKAFRHLVIPTHPDVVVFFDGLNDLTQAETPEQLDKATANYLDYVEKEKNLALENGIKVVFAPQPFLPAKRVKSKIEKEILARKVNPNAQDIDWVPLYVRSHSAVQQKMAEKVDNVNTFLVDVSGAFSGEKPTTFTDFWHFSDPGHELVAESLVAGLEPVLKTSPLP